MSQSYADLLVMILDREDLFQILGKNSHPKATKWIFWSPCLCGGLPGVMACALNFFGLIRP